MDEHTLNCLRELYIAPRTVSSDFARQYAQEIAALASQSLISTKEAKDAYGRLWRVTSPGINQLIAHGLL